MFSHRQKEQAALHVINKNQHLRARCQGCVDAPGVEARDLPFLLGLPSIRVILSRMINGKIAPGPPLGQRAGMPGLQPQAGKKYQGAHAKAVFGYLFSVKGKIKIEVKGHLAETENRKQQTVNRKPLSEERESLWLTGKR